MGIRSLGTVRPSLGDRVFVAPSAEVIGDVTLGADTGIWFGAVLRGDIARISVGDRSNVQDNAVIHTDCDTPCLIGADVTIGHGAIVHGATVHDGALIGMGAIVLNRAVVGEGAIVAAGALVPEGKEIPARWLAIGVPAKPVRELTPAELERTRKNTAHYVAEKDRYLQDLG